MLLQFAVLPVLPQSWIWEPSWTWRPTLCRPPERLLKALEGMWCPVFLLSEKVLYKQIIYIEYFAMVINESLIVVKLNFCHCQIYSEKLYFVQVWRKAVSPHNTTLCLHCCILQLTDIFPPACSVNTSIKHSPVPAKLSQKQRKMLAMANKEASVESSASKPTPTGTPSKSSGKAWWVSPNLKSTTHRCWQKSFW